MKNSNITKDDLKTKKTYTYLIFNNLFTEQFTGLLSIIKNLLSIYNNFKLNSYINKIKKGSSNNIEFEIVNYNKYKTNIEGIRNEFNLSDLRQELTREKYSKIVNRIKQRTQRINSILFKHLNESKLFTIGRIQLACTLEIHLIRSIDQHLGEIELIQAIIDEKRPDNTLFFNCDKDLVKFIKLYLSNHNCQYYNEKLTTIFKRIIKEFDYIHFLLVRIVIYFLNKYKKPAFPKHKKNVVVIANTINQYRTIKFIFKKLKGVKEINPIFYVQKNALSLYNLAKYFVFLRYMMTQWKKSRKLIFPQIGIDQHLVDYFFNKEFRYLLTSIFNEFHQLSKSFHKDLISLVTISNQNRVESKIAASICKLKGIPTIYLPHASVPIDNQILCYKKFSYLALWGTKDLDFYRDQLGMSSNQLILTGNPGFEHYYTKQIKTLKEVKDMFTNRIYSFNKDKFTILLATNTFDQVSKEKELIVTIKSLKELNLIDNLIIKLHPAELGLQYKELFKTLNINPIIVRDYDVFELIKSSSILISTTSSIILEAMIIGTPVILANFINLEFMLLQPYAFTSSEFVKTAENQESLTTIIKSLKENKEEYLNYSTDLIKKSSLFSYYDEKEPPSEKLINLILNITKKY